MGQGNPFRSTPSKDEHTPGPSESRFPGGSQCSRHAGAAGHRSVRILIGGAEAELPVFDRERDELLERTRFRPDTR